MKISLKDVRKIIREELMKEIAASGLPQAANSFQQVPSLQKGFNDLVRTYKNVLVMQGIVHNNPNAAQMSNQQLDQVAQQYDATAQEAAAKFQQSLAEFLDDSFVEDVRSLSRGQRAQAGRADTQHAPPVVPPAPVGGRRARDNADAGPATIAPPRM